MDIFQLPGILLKRWRYILVPTLIFAALGLAYVLLSKPTFTVEVELLIDPRGLITERGDLVPTASASVADQSIIESQIYVLQSSEILTEVVKKLDLTQDPFLFRGPAVNKELADAAVVYAIQRNLKIQRAGQSFIITLTFKHRDVAKAAEIANTIASIYLKKVHEAQSDASSRASEAFELQAHALAERVRKAEQELETFKAEHNIVSTGPQQGLVIDQQVEGVNKQLIEAKADLSARQASYLQAQSLTVGSIQDGAIPEALASTALGNMRARYAEILARMNELSSSLGSGHPQMKAIRSQAAGMRQAIEQELARIRHALKSDVERAEARVRSLEERLKELTKTSTDTSEAGIKARELQSEVDTLRALYTAFLSRSEELGRRETVNINNSRIISKAVPAGSVSRLAQLLVLVASTLFGFAFGCGLAVLREIIGNTFGAASRPRHLVTERDKAAEQPVEEPDEEPVTAPVIAHMPATGGKGGLRFGNGAIKGGQSRAKSTGVSLTVDRILNMEKKREPSTILLLSPDNDDLGRDMTRELADALYRRDKDVYFSLGEGAERGEKTDAVDIPLGDVLKYQRLCPIRPAAQSTATPTFRHFARKSRAADYVIIDAQGEAARRHLDELLEQANGIIVLASERQAKRKLEGLLRELAPFKDRMLGTILFHHAA
jgi:succinoglycan biosynthesis transport protein ExoP